MTQTVQELHLVRYKDSALFVRLLVINHFILPNELFPPPLQGVLGGLCSGKSALVHRHMTGSYLPLENAEGRFHLVVN